MPEIGLKIDGFSFESRVIDNTGNIEIIDNKPYKQIITSDEVSVGEENIDNKEVEFITEINEMKPVILNVKFKESDEPIGIFGFIVGDMFFNIDGSAPNNKINEKLKTFLVNNESVRDSLL